MRPRTDNPIVNEYLAGFFTELAATIYCLFTWRSMEITYVGKWRVLITVNDRVWYSFGEGKWDE